MVGNEKMENYLKTILKIQNTYGSVRGIDISRELDVSKPTVSVAVHELEKEGYVNCISSSNIILTKKGAELAKMLRYLGVKEENARIDACKMEHSVCDESYQALLDFFFHNHPDIIKQDDKGYKELFF